MFQETTPAVVERGAASSVSIPLESPSLVAQQAMPRVSRLALTALALGGGTFLALLLMGLDGWLMSQSLLETHDLPEIGTWVPPLPTLLTLVLAFLAKGRIAASGGALTGWKLVKGSFWLAGINVVLLVGFAGLLLSSAGEAYMCGGG